MLDAMPNNKQLERQFIGQAITDKRLPSESSTTEFYDQNCRAMWAACLELSEQGREIEPFAVIAIARKNGLTRDIQVSELLSWSAGLVPRADFTNYAVQLRDLALTRWTMRELFEQIQFLEKGGAVIDAVEVLRSRFDVIQTDLAPRKDRFASMAEIVEQDIKPALDRLRQGKTNRISTGFARIDREIGGGIQAPEVIVVGADTGGGKSALVLQMAINMANDHVPVAYISGEMSDEENGLRAVSQRSQTHNLNSQTHIFDDEYHNLVKWADAMKMLPIYFDSRSTDLKTIKASLRSMVKNKGIKVAVLDYLQIYKNDPNDRRRRVERIADASQEVKRIAVELGIAIIEVVQLNREGAKSGKPTLHDLDGSGQIEKDASLVMLIDREPHSNKVTLRIVKGRNSGTCPIPGEFQGSTLNFNFDLKPLET